MSTADDRDDLDAILAKHWHQYPMQTHDGYHPNACSCGEPIDDPGILAPLSEAMAIHRAHVAQMVLESDWLRGVRAKELRDAAQQYIERGVMPGSPSNVSLWLIDRADRVDAEDGPSDECQTCGATGTHDCRDYLTPNGQTGE